MYWQRSGSVWDMHQSFSTSKSVLLMVLPFVQFAELFLGLSTLFCAFFSTVSVCVCVFISRLMWHCWPVLTSLLLSQEKKLLCFYKCKKCSPRAQAQTHRHTNSQYDSYGVTDTASRKYKAVFLLKTLPIYVDVEMIWNINKKQWQYIVCLHTHTNMQNKDRIKYLYEETAGSLSLLELKDTLLKTYNNSHTQTQLHT